MRPDTLVFLHLLSGTVLVGALVTTVIAAAASARASTPEPALLRRLAWWTGLGSAAAAFATIALGEATKAREHVSPAWLDVASGLSYTLLLFGGAGLAALARLALTRPWLARWVARTAALIAATALTVAFLMASKPA